MQEYLEKLLSQIRCAKARPYISEEIKGHIESQIEDNILSGMSQEEAERKAVEDMGDPVEAGISLDKIHRPRMAWRLLIIIGILSLLGICVQMSIFFQTQKAGLDAGDQYMYQYYIRRYVIAVVLGFLTMWIVYFLDYTWIAKWAKGIGIFVLAISALYLCDTIFAPVRAPYFLFIGSFHLNIRTVMMFFVPAYGGILYQYRGGGFQALLRAVIWLCTAVVIAFKLPSLVTAAFLLVSMLLQLTMAVWKGWFKVPVKKTIAVLWSTFMGLPILSLGIMYHFELLKTYQIERIRSFLNASGDGFYITSILRKLKEDAIWIGNSGRDVIGSLPDFNGDYVFAYIISSHGWAFGIVVVAVLAVFVLFIFSAILKQKNELGQVMSFGCGLILLLNILLNLLGTLGLIPLTTTFLPFLSSGGSNIYLTYLLLGIVMSVYRYKEVYPKRFRDKSSSEKWKKLRTYTGDLEEAP